MRSQSQQTDVKKTLTKFGKVTILKSHRYIQSNRNGFGISPFMQELMVYAGHLECYEKCNEVLEKFLSIEVSTSQVYRVTDSVSKGLRERINPQDRILPPIAKDNLLYVELAGSMVQTSEEGWKEVKLARLFKGVIV